MFNREPSLRKRREPLTDSNLLLFIAGLIFVSLYIFAIIAYPGSFWQFQKFFDLFNNNAALIILACGLSIVMVGGGIDISVGGVTAMVTMSCAVYLDSAAGNIWVSLLVALGIGLAFGLLQGFLVAYLEIQPFIITLAGMFLARGLVTIISKTSHSVANPGLRKLMANAKWEIGWLGRYAPNGTWIPLKLEIGMFIALAVVAAVVFVLKWTRFGRDLYAVGGNSQSALMLGIKVKRTKFLSYLICGLLAGIAGFVYLLKTGSGDPSHANGFEMKAIAASIIGGTLLTGGVGNIIGSPIGVITLMTIESLVITSGLTTGRQYMQGIMTGAMLGLAILLQSIVLSRRGKKLAVPQWLEAMVGGDDRYVQD
ncbi:MAG: sugar ABC transporter permease YjfF [Oscillospiraceae bacterium]|nr:sugar ABC transporter permease YjfF [Oscillospiraceae bacterium]